MNRRLLALGAMGAVAFAAGITWRLRSDDAAGSVGAATGGAAVPTAAGALPDAGTPAEFWSGSVERLDGSALALSSFRGQRLIVNFWATWCPPCVKEMPVIDRVYRDVGPASGPRGWRFLGLAIDRRDAVAKFLQQQPVAYDIALAGFQGTEWSRALGNTNGGLPFTVAFDVDGRMTQRKLGEISENELRGWTAG